MLGRCSMDNLRNRRYIKVDDIKKRIIVSHRQLELYNRCPRLFQFYSSNMFTDNKMLYQDFKDLHAKQFEDTLKTVIRYNILYDKPIITSDVVKQYMNYFVRHKNTKIMVSQLDPLEQVVEGQQLTVDTLKHLYQINKMNYVKSLIGNNNYNDYKVIGYIDEYKVYLRYVRPYVFINKYPYTKFNIYYPIVDTFYKTKDLMYTDNMQYVFLQYTIKKTRSLGRTIRANKTYNVQYINPLSNDIYELPFKANYIIRRADMFIQKFLSDLIDDNYTHKSSNDCLDCPMYLYCSSQHMKNKSKTWNSLSKIKFNKKQFVDNINKLLDGYEDNTELVYFDCQRPTT